MRGELLEVEAVVESDELRCELEESLCSFFKRSVSIDHLERRLSQYSSSYVLEEVDVLLDDGTSLELIFKDMSINAMLEGATRVKPRFVYNPTREIDTYRHLLKSYPVGTPTFYGAVVAPEIQRYWLFIERLPPVMLWQMGNPGDWHRTARWLAGMHERLRPAAEPRRAPQLLVHDRGFYHRWMERAEQFVTAGDHRAGRAAAKAISWLADRYDVVVERLVSLPTTVVHGEFFAANVLVDARPDGLRISPVDWEMAAIGPGLVDLAGLTSGNWSAAERESMALAYYHATPEAYRNATAPRTFLEDLEYCRLHQSVQWIGWTPGWTPPPEHAQDWFSEAMRSAEVLGL